MQTRVLWCFAAYIYTTPIGLSRGFFFGLDHIKKTTTSVSVSFFFFQVRMWKSKSQSAVRFWRTILKTHLSFKSSWTQLETSQFRVRKSSTENCRFYCLVANSNRNAYNSTLDCLCVCVCVYFCVGNKMVWNLVMNLLWINWLNNNKNTFVFLLLFLWLVAAHGTGGLIQIFVRANSLTLINKTWSNKKSKWSARFGLEYEHKHKQPRNTWIYRGVDRSYFLVAYIQASLPLI